MNNSPELAQPLPTETETEAALRRVLTCERFRKNPSLRHMLEYLVTRTLQGEQNRIKETTVAMDVFGRTQDFDSRIDNIVRVQAHRLRKVLGSYYDAEGAGERIRFSIPRGGYIPLIEQVSDGPAEPVAVEAAPASLAGRAPEHEPDLRLAEGRRFSAWMVALAFLGGLLISLGGLAAYRLARPGIVRAAGSENARTGALAAVWGSVFTPGVNCVVSYSNPVFLATGNPPGPRILIPYSGLVSVPSGARIDLSPTDLNLRRDLIDKDSAFYFSDGWTGVGEVAATQRIATLLAPEVALRVVRSRALTYADMTGSNVVFLGSPWANEMQKKINVGVTPLVNDNDGNIVNLNPRNGEPPRFRTQVDEGTRQMIATYGLFSVLPGVSRGTKVFISAGVNTYGTAGAVEFMTSSSGVEEVMRRLGKPLPEYFQVVVRSEMIRGEPAETRLILARAVKRPS